MNKELQFNDNSRESLLKGMEVLADAVGSTLGPKGRCVIIDEYVDDKPLITKDGVTVAKSIQLKDKFQNLGCQLLKEASTQTVSIVGDGTTTSCVLAYYMVKEASRLIDSGYNPIEIKNQIKPISDKILSKFHEISVPVTDEDLEKVATVSANNDNEIGKLIAEAFKKIGRNGVVTIEESPSVKTYTDIITGMQFERGYESPFFATDPIKGICTLEDCLVLITDQKVQMMRDLVPVLEIAVKKGKPLLIIANDYDDEVIQNLKINVVRGIVKVCAVKAPSYGDYRKAVLDDIAILTNSVVITYESGIELSKVEESMLGGCRKVVVTKETTTIIEGKGSKDLIEQRVQQIDSQLENLSDTTDRDFLKDFYAQRKAKLTGGICRIYVGGTTELEMRERKDRFDDAVCATKAAIEEGIVPGGGISFMKVAELVSNPHKIDSEVYTDAEQMIFKSCSAVFNKILENCGEKLDIPVNPINDIGYNVNSGECVNMLDAGIVNPTKCDRLAFENAISVLNLYLSSSCLIVNEVVEF